MPAGKLPSLKGNMPVREFLSRDLAEVVTLYWNYMAGRAGPVPAQLLASFTELYFANPLSDASPSFVYQDVSGDILGFMGVTTRSMLLSGRPIRVGLAGNFVIHPKARSGIAAPSLMGAYIAGDQDLLVTDTANDISRHIFQRLRFQTIPELNFHWARPLRPCQYLTYALAHEMSPMVSAVFRRATKPICIVGDGLVGNVFARAPQTETALHSSELAVETLRDCLIEFREAHSLRAEYDIELLRWLLGFMSRNSKRGTLRGFVLYDNCRKDVGWYLYYAKRDAIGEVVQIGGKPDLFNAIFSHLLQDAREQGVVALHGRADFHRLADFSDQGCFFTCRGGWTLAFSRHGEIIDILRRGNGSLSRLDGEWCLDPGE